MNLSYRVISCLFVVLSFITQIHAQEKTFELASPDGQLSVTIRVSDQIYYTIHGNNKELLTNNRLALNVNGTMLGKNPQLHSAKKTKGNELIKPSISLKFSTVKNEYTNLLLTFKEDYAVEFRAFNEGVAYRFVLNKKGDIAVMNEEFSINFPENVTLDLQQANGFKTSYEERYSHLSAADWKPADKMSTLPVLMDTKRGYKILISEADVVDYPCMFLKSTGNNGAEGTFPKNPLEFGPDGDRSLKILKEADYIAKTKGTRALPWRYFVITQHDTQLIENTMTG